jgi:serine/threonine-protein kinase
MDARFEAQALEILDEVLEKPAGERETWLTERCGPDTVLRERVAKLLKLGDMSLLRTGAAVSLAEDAEAPERIGAYRITGLIGQGGMGAVYRGERASGDFDHVAAIKLIRPGVLSDELVERFRRERQTLARLGHPNIARLFDGGETEAGQPFLVMEYVEGRPLHAWLEEERPALRERLDMFMKVCRAVGYAHQNLVIHRDLTPANVLVDGDGDPKLIDFGIARPIGEGGGKVPAQTATPGFAAPERLHGAAATTLSDIFALGRLLERVVGSDVDSELTAIIGRASATEPELRYPSADALADDIERHRTGRTVAAVGKGRAYALRKFVARNRTGVVAAAAALVLIVGALVTSLVALGAAQRARSAETARFNQLRSLAGYMLFDLNDQLRRVPGNVAARSSLAGQAQRYLSGLASSSDASPELRLEIVDGLIELARVQGSPAEPNLGDAALARANLDRAGKVLDDLSTDVGMTPEVARRVVALRSHLAMIQLHGLKDAKASEQSLEAAQRALFGIPHNARGAEWHEARRLMRRARLEFFDLQERVADLERERRLVESDMSEWPTSLKVAPAAAIDRGNAAYYEGIARLVRQQGDKGLAAFSRALASYEQAYARDARPSTLYLMGWSAFLGFEAASATGDKVRASRLVARARDLAGRLRALDDKDDASYVLSRNAEEAYAQDLANHGRFAEALAAHGRVIAETERRLRTYGGTGVDLAYSRMLEGVTARKAGDRALACRSWGEAERRFDDIARKGKLLDFFANFRPGLQANLRLCAAGAPTTSFKELR